MEILQTKWISPVFIALASAMSGLFFSFLFPFFKREKKKGYLCLLLLFLLGLYIFAGIEATIINKGFYFSWIFIKNVFIHGFFVVILSVLAPIFLSRLLNELFRDGMSKKKFIILCISLSSLSLLFQSLINNLGKTRLIIHFLSAVTPMTIIIVICGLFFIGFLKDG